VSTNRYIGFVELSSGLIKDSRIPLFSSKFSKKTYTQHQLLILLLLKEYLSEDYRDTVELTEIMDSLREKIHLEEIPHFTTIHKFYVLDKGYDSEDIHRLIRDKINAYSLIPVRTRKRKWISGVSRRELARSFDQTCYHQRNKVETIFSVLKGSSEKL
jgi:hypothetical protein